MKELFFLGAGKMASAIAAGVVKSSVHKSDELSAYDVLPQACKSFTDLTGVECCCDAVSGVSGAERILVAVKPQMIESALSPLKSALKDKLVISIAAGVTIERLRALTGAERIIRVMPNTPAMAGEGASAFTASCGAAQSDKDFVQKLLGAVGTVTEVSENLMDAVTGLSGSGPAYVFTFIQALADGGVAEGLSRSAALELAVQTVLGAAKMVKESNLHPMELCDQVTSPAGTTSRALEVLAERGFSGTVIQSVRAAAARSRELGAEK